jgi:hypothetical protein
MFGTRIASFVRHNAIALTALFVALGGTGYAAVTINGANIKNGSITAKKLKKHTLTGTQINVKKLGTVPAAKKASSAATATTAATATNATELGGAPASAYLKAGCGPGRVEGYATIEGGAPSFPSTYTSASPFVTGAFNCSGGAVQVRRGSTGAYEIQFAGDPGTIGFANVVGCAAICVSTPPYAVTVTYISSGSDAGGFAVVVRNSEDASKADAAVNVLIP